MVKANCFLNNETAQATSMPVMAVMSLILLGSILYVGISVMDGIHESTALESGDTFYNASSSVTTGVETAFGMSGTLLLIVIAAAILGSLISVVAYVR